MKRELEGYVFFKDAKFHPGRIYIENGKIKSVEEIPEVSLSPEESKQYIIPGLVDVHSHGCFGHDTCDADPDGLREMIKFEESRGITSYCPTTMTFHEDKLTKVVEVVKEVAKETKTIKGIYLEGPFISREKCGAQNPEFIMKPDAKMVRRLNKASGNLCRVVAIAPETEGALDFIKELSGEIVCSIAHTTSDYDTAVKAIKNGAKEITHLYNALPVYSHRNPGVIGAAMDDENIRVELIADGVHVHPAVVRNTFRYFGADRIMLISDSMEATGMPNGKYSLGGQDVYVEGRLATLKDKTIAGSASTLYDVMVEAIKMGVSKEDAIVSATRTPAKQIGIFDKVGSIEKGKDADLLVVDKDFNLKEVVISR